MEETEQTLEERSEITLAPGTENDLPAPEIEIRPFDIAGFWRRGFASVVDVAILATPLLVLGFILQDLAFSLGPWGRIIGYGILFLYWGYCHSKYGHGQTIGKKLMRIAVVDSSGDYLPVTKAILRALALGSISLLNGWAVPFMQNPIAVFIGATIIFGGGLALVYGLVFNRRTRQGIHDLAIGSYVCKVPLVPGAFAPETRRIHTRISYGLVVFGLALGLVSLIVQMNKPTLGMLEPGEWEELEELQSTLLENDEFFSVGVQRSNRSQLGGSRELKDLVVQVWVKKSCVREPEYCDEAMKRIARTALDKYDKMDNLTGMRIIVTSAFDLGLARGSLFRRGDWTIEDWRKQLEE